jgi:hypothetical protein
MGQSRTIEDKAKEDAKFREFMATLDKESKAEEQKIYGEIVERVARHYKGNNWDHARLFGDMRSDYQNYDDWSLTRVANIITAIGDALSASDYPSPAVPGSDKAAPDTIEKAKDFAGVFAGDYSLIIARVKALVSSALSQFSVASEVTHKAVLQDLPLSGGLHLFFGSSGKVYKRSDFFTSQFIGSFQIVFETYMSVAEARAIGIQQILAATERELAGLNEEIIMLREAQAASLKAILKTKPEDYVSTRATYSLALEVVKEDRAQVLQQYDKYNSVVAAVDQHFARLDFSEFGRPNLHDNPISLAHLFTEWEAGIARRYIREKLQSAIAYQPEGWYERVACNPIGHAPGQLNGGTGTFNKDLGIFSCGNFSPVDVPRVGDHYNLNGYYDNTFYTFDNYVCTHSGKTSDFQLKIK